MHVVADCFFLARRDVPYLTERRIEGGHAMAENPYESPRTESRHVAAAAAATPSSDPMLWEIRKQAGNAVFCGVIAFVIGIFFAPIAIVCGRKALRLIQQHNKGHEYEERARLGIKLGYVGIGIFIFFFILILGGLIAAILLHNP